MLRNKLVLGLAFILILGLCVYLGASDRDQSFRHNQNPMNRLHSVTKEAKPPLPPDFELPGEVKKPCQALAEAGTGAIRGRVTQAPGGTTPIENVYVAAGILTCPYYSNFAYSDPDGYYIIESLPAGKYEVNTENESIFVDIYWNNKPLWGIPDTVTVFSNDTTEDINFSLRVGGKITGRVTMPGSFFTYITVHAEDTTSEIDYYGDALILSDSVSYEIRKLPTGFYKVNTANSDSFVSVYYNNKPDWETANPVRAKEDSTTTNIDFTLALGGKITGTVTLPGASSVSELVFATNTSTGDYYYGIASGSGSSGSYQIVGLPTGSYKVNIYNSGGYLGEYYNDKPDESSADTVQVGLGGIRPNVDFALTLGGIIKGTISSSAKGPLKGVFVYAFTTTNPYWYESYGSTNASGIYRIDKLRSGYYKILAYGDTTYAPKYYNNKTSWSIADSVLVTVSDSVSGKNIALEVGGSISGHVYGQGGVPLSGAIVSASGAFDQFGVSKWKITPADGSYLIGGLPTGYYRVRAYDGCNYIYYNNKTAWIYADTVLVNMPSNTPNINFNFPSAVGDEETQPSVRPTEFELSQNYPNPFNPGTQIEYTLQKKALVNLEIYNLLGQKVKMLMNEYQSPGSYHILWDGKNEQNLTVASGVYFYRLKVNGAVQTKRMVLLR